MPEIEYDELSYKECLMIEDIQLYMEKSPDEIFYNYSEKDDHIDRIDRVMAYINWNKENSYKAIGSIFKNGKFYIHLTRLKAAALCQKKKSM